LYSQSIKCIVGFYNTYKSNEGTLNNNNDMLYAYVFVCVCMC